MESLICALGSVSFAFSLSEDEVQRDTQLCVDDGRECEQYDSYSFLSESSCHIKFDDVFYSLRLAKILQRDELAKKIKLNIYKRDRFIRILCTFAPE